MIVKIQRIGVIALLLVLGACSSPGVVKDSTTAAKPKWILDTPTFPGELYGSGSAEMFAGIDEAKVRAKERGLANLLSDLELTIHASTTSRESLRKDSRTGEVFLHQVDQLVQTRIPEYELRFVEIDAHYIDKGENRIYVLVKLDLNRERGYLRSELSVHDNELARLSDDSASLTTSSIATLRKISAGLVALAQRGDIKQQLNRLNKSAKPLLTAKQQDLKRKFEQMLANVKVSIPKSVENKNRKIYTVIAEQLTSRGIKVANGKGDINIDYEIELTSVDRDGVVFTIVDGDVSLRDRHGDLILSFKAKAKGSSTNAKISKERALNKLARRLADEIVQSLF